MHWWSPLLSILVWCFCLHLSLSYAVYFCGMQLSAILLNISLSPTILIYLTFRVLLCWFFCSVFSFWKFLLSKLHSFCCCLSRCSSFSLISYYFTCFFLFSWVKPFCLCCLTAFLFECCEKHFKVISLVCVSFERVKRDIVSDWMINLPVHSCFSPDKRKLKLFVCL